MKTREQKTGLCLCSRTGEHVNYGESNNVIWPKSLDASDVVVIGKNAQSEYFDGRCDYFDTMYPMTKTVQAVYENGVFRPLSRLEGIAEHRQVTLTVTAQEQPSSLTDLAGRISVDDAEDMRSVIEREFEHIDPREWQ